MCVKEHDVLKEAELNHAYHQGHGERGVGIKPTETTCWRRSFARRLERGLVSDSKETSCAAVAVAERKGRGAGERFERFEKLEILLVSRKSPVES